MLHLAVVCLFAKCIKAAIYGYRIRDLMHGSSYHRNRYGTLSQNQNISDFIFLLQERDLGSLCRAQYSKLDS